MQNLPASHHLQQPLWCGPHPSLPQSPSSLPHTFQKFPSGSEEEKKKKKNQSLTGALQLQNPCSLSGLPSFSSALAFPNPSTCTSLLTGSYTWRLAPASGPLHMPPAPLTPRWGLSCIPRSLPFKMTPQTPDRLYLTLLSHDTLPLPRKCVIH